MSERRKSLLDLVPSGPVRSEVFDFLGQEARWRILNDSETDGCRCAAEKRIFNRLVNELSIEPKDAYQIARAGGDTWQMWFETYIIGAAMTNVDGEPISRDPPDDVAQRLADTLSPIQREKWVNDYLQFADEHDPSNISDEEREEIIAEVGKGGASTLQQRGSNVLRSLLLSTAQELVQLRAKLEALGADTPLEARVEALETKVDALAAEISQMRRLMDGSSSPSG